MASGEFLIFPGKGKFAELIFTNSSERRVEKEKVNKF
jgi:hypothetical protein